mgnify:CR=1 FL=1
MTQLAERIRVEVEKRADPKRREDLHRYFKEPIETYGLNQTQNKEIAKKFYPEVKGDFEAALELTEELMVTGNMDLASVGLRILDRFRLKLGAEQFPLFDDWVEYLNNWATTDHFATHHLMMCIKDNPTLVEELVKWTSHENRWRRRASAVTMVPIARKGEMLEEVFRIANELMLDKDDMVQKGVGWMLKEASKKQPQEIHHYLLKWKQKSPALILRYASEKLPDELRVLKTN